MKTRLTVDKSINYSNNFPNWSSKMNSDNAQHIISKQFIAGYHAL